MKKVKNIIAAIFALVLVVICVLPFIYIFFRSFVVYEQVTFQSYYDVFLGSPKFLYRFWKSMGMSVVIAGGQLLVSVMAGYGFGRYKFKGRDTLFFLMMILMTLPVQVTLVPNFIMLNNLGILDTYA
ncbi:MAG: carbohydrate ABC transporter permease, partial [Clostridia bacterium]|nr:carbohydrate ABC transporter permease [Clostridia bacterium]